MESRMFTWERSEDGIHWDFDKDKVRFVDEEGNEFYAGICV